MSNAMIDNLILRANGGDREACFSLYQEYKNGVNVGMDESEALDWLEKAIDLEHPIAQLIMGLSFLNIGSVKDAIDYLTLASNQQNLDAQNILGQLYMGNVVGIENAPVDKAAGIDLLHSSAAGGNKYAQLTLGKCYLNGDGIVKDMFLAEIWLEKARAQGMEEADVLLDNAHTVISLMN